MSSGIDVANADIGEQGLRRGLRRHAGERYCMITGSTTRPSMCISSA
jgi:hypothetical protein